MRALEAELVRLEAEAGGAAAAHAAAQERAGEVRERIRETARALREAREAHDVAVGRLADRLVALYVEEPPTLVEVVLGSGGLSTRSTPRRPRGHQRRRRPHRQLARGDARSGSPRLRAELEGERAEADAALDEAAQRLAQMEGLLRSRRAVLAQAAAALDALVAREQRREAAAVRRERAAAIDAGGRAGGGGGATDRADPAPPRPPSPAAPAAPAAAGGASAVPGGPSQEVLDRIAACESGGDPRAVSASGQYRGKYQFDPGTWRGVGGTGDPAAASEAEQDLRAAMLYAQSGPAPWPVCGYR